MNHKLYVPLIFLSLIASPLSAQRMLPEFPEAIFYNGKIITVDNETNISQAFAVKDGRFLAVGDDSEVRGLAGPDTNMVDLHRHTVMPGMMDDHNHQFHVILLTLRGMDLQGVGSLAEMLERLQQAAVTAPRGEPIFTRMGGWDFNDFPEQRPPSRQDLDQVSRQHPVVVFESRARLYVNSVALEMLGLSRDTEDHVRIGLGRDQNGELNGVINGSGAAALHLSAKVVPLPDLEEKKALIKHMHTRQHAMGLTGIRELQLFPEVMRAYYELWREGGLTMRVSMGLELNAGEESGLEAMIAPWGVASGFGDEWLRIDGIAEFNLGDQVREPFSHTGETGTLRTSVDSYKQAILMMNRYGWRPSIHVEGDRTLDIVLDAFEAADRERPIKDRRWIVEHAVLIHPEQIKRIKSLGVMVSAQYQPYGRSAALLRQWGPERTERAHRIRDLLDAEIIVAGGSDWPGAPNNPFLNIYYYVTRDTQQFGPMGLDQKISRIEALRVMTLNNAYLTYEEDIKGSIEPGKLADFLVLSDDILTVPEEQIKNIVPLATYVGGQNVYSSPDRKF